MYVLADCNNFFVSCERVFRPDLQHRPVIVLSGNDGCVVSRSNEAKALGIAMGAPLFQIQNLVKKAGVECFSSNFPLYGDLSQRVMSLLGKQATEQMQYSIDECFLRFDQLNDNELKPFCEQLVKTVLQGTGIPISIGIAPSKTLAKVASRYAKKYAGYHGVCFIQTPSQRRKALQQFDIADVWGIGRQARKKLEAIRITTALEFADCQEDAVRLMLHKPGLETWQELNGQDVIKLNVGENKQSITCSRTFATGLSNLQQIENQVADFCARCGTRLRNQQSVCAQITVYVCTSRFLPSEKQFNLCFTLQLATPTDNTQELICLALRALRNRIKNGITYKKAGVILQQISQAQAVQGQLFDKRNRLKDKSLQNAIDCINAQWGTHTVVCGAQSLLADPNVVYKQDFHSPHYTTRLQEIMLVKA